jgi:hypothetical protein
MKRLRNFMWNLWVWLSCPKCYARSFLKFSFELFYLHFNSNVKSPSLKRKSENIWEVVSHGSQQRSHVSVFERFFLLTVQQLPDKYWQCIGMNLWNYLFWVMCISERNRYSTDNVPFCNCWNQSEASNFVSQRHSVFRSFGLYSWNVLFGFTGHLYFSTVWLCLFVHCGVFNNKK